MPRAKARPAADEPPATPADDKPGSEQTTVVRPADDEPVRRGGYVLTDNGWVLEEG